MGLKWDFYVKNIDVTFLGQSPTYKNLILKSLSWSKHFGTLSVISTIKVVW